MEHVEGKRVASPGGKSGGKKVLLIVLCAVAAALAAGYLGLCAWAGSPAFWPNTAIAGVDVSGRTQAQAADVLSEALPQRLASSGASFVCQGRSYTVSGDDPAVSADPSAAASGALAEQAGDFFTRGGRFLAALAGGQKLSLDVKIDGSPAAVEQAVKECAGPMTETSWTLEGDKLVLRKGTTGRVVDTDSLLSELEARFGLLLSGSGENYPPIEAKVSTEAPAEPDFNAIRDQVRVEAADAYLDQDTYEIVPSVTGVDFDPAAAKAALDGAAEGEEVSFPVELTQPAITTESLEANLFKDVLGYGTTHCSSPAERWYNIDLAASRVNGVILMPGDEFSYNDHCGPYTLDSGYKKAGTYQNGQSVDATAGGICQLSSTLYWVTLKANLEITERNKHAFNGGYMPVIGTDATVWSDQLDFRFKNNTDYPIKIEAYQDKNHDLHVTIRGTDTTGIHGEPYSVVVSKVPYKNTYQPRDTIPVGSEPQRDPNYNRYNGYTVDVYQKLVDKNGKTVDTIFLYRNTYRASDAVYYYNPADAARLGIDPATGLMTLTPVTPTPSASPSGTPSPTPSAQPTPAVTPSAQPSPAESPASSPAPGESPASSAQPTPAESAAPSPTPAPSSTPETGPGMEPVA